MADGGGDAGHFKPPSVRDWGRGGAFYYISRPTTPPFRYFYSYFRHSCAPFPFFLLLYYNHRSITNINIYLPKTLRPTASPKSLPLQPHRFLHTFPFYFKSVFCYSHHFNHFHQFYQSIHACCETSPTKDVYFPTFLSLNPRRVAYSDHRLSAYSTALKEHAALRRN